MITEDYVSFELAKLLKEKGFDEPVGYFYRFDSEDLYRGTEVTNTQIGDRFYNAPTLQMAMKWLRDVHKWFIHITIIREASCWLADIQDIKNDVNIYAVENEFPNYEQACEAAIKYCLENLI